MSEVLPNGEFSMGLSMPVNSQKPPEPSSSRERRGKPQTTYSKRMVRSMVWRQEQTHGRPNMAFVTCTLPDFSDSDLELICANWGEVNRRFKQSVEDDLERAGVSPEVVCITEIQEQRYRESGKVYPHLHLTFQSRKNLSSARKTRYQDYAISKERIRILWERAVSNVLGKPVSIPYGTRIEQVKKSAENYMSKYMSKAGKLTQEIIDAGMRHLLPATWWSATKTLRDWVKDNTKQLTEDSKEFLRENYKELKHMFSWLHTKEVEVWQPHGESITIPVCIVGKLKREWLDALEYKEHASN